MNAYVYLVVYSLICIFSSPQSVSKQQMFKLNFENFQFVSNVYDFIISSTGIGIGKRKHARIEYSYQFIDFITMRLYTISTSSLLYFSLIFSVSPEHAKDLGQS